MNNPLTLTPEEVSTLLEECPHFFLEQERICAQLTEAQFDYAIKEAPVFAIHHDYVGDRITDDQLSYLIKRHPALVLESEWACKRISNKQFDSCVKRGVFSVNHKALCDRLSNKQFEEYLVSNRALRSKYACARMSDSQFDVQIHQSSNDALEYPYTCKRLNNTQFEYCLKTTLDCLHYKHVLTRVTPKQFDDYVRARPNEALVYPQICKRLTDEQFNSCFNKEFPTYLLKYKHIRNRLTDISLEDAFKRNPYPVMVCKQIQPRITPYQKNWCSVLIKQDEDDDD
jgi:hypothetical protein